MITAAALLALVLFITLLASGRGWNNMLSPARNDLVFAGRNQAYGAYRMRREHHGVMLVAFLTSLGLVSAGLALPKLLFTSSTPVPVHSDEGIIVQLDDVFDPQTRVEPERTAVQKRNNPDDMVAPVVVDSVKTTPKDTTSTHTDPGPVNPVGPIGPVGPVGPVGSGRDTTHRDPGPTPLPPVDKMPEYPGGENALKRDLQRLVHYPEIALTAGQEGRVLVGFIVDEDGSMTDIKVVRSVSPSLDAEAVRVVRNLKTWIPGQFRGSNVKVRYALPINFKLAKQ